MLLLILFIFVTSGFSLLKIIQTGQELDKIANENLPLYQRMTSVTINQLEQAHWLEKAIRYGLMDDSVGLSTAEETFLEQEKLLLANLRRSKEIINAAIANVKSKKLQTEFKSLFSRIVTVEEDYQTYSSHVRMTLDDVRAGKIGTIEMHMEMIEPEEEAISKAVEQIMLQVEAFNNASIEAARQNEEQTRFIMQIMTPAALIIGLLLGFFIARNILSQIGGEPATVMRFAESIAKGDLSQNIDTAAKRATGIAQSMLQMQEGLRRIASSIMTSVEKTQERDQTLSTSAAQTASSVNEIAATIRSMNDQISRLSRSVADSTSAVSGIRDNIDNLGSQINNQVSAVTETSSAVEEISASIGSIAKTANEKSESTKKLMQSLSDGKEKINETSDQIEAISNRAAEMIEMIDVINNISSQTDLLSMNAAIEAAHAGEQGRGFAVVAEEIRNLAVSTAENAKIITTNLQEILDTIQSLGTTSEQTLQFYGSIETNAQETIDAFTEISYTMDELSSGAQEINNAMSTLSDTSNEVNNGSNEIQGEMDVIQNTTEDVQNVSGEVLNAIQEMGAGITQINDAMNELNESISVISGEIEQINSQVRSFKL